VNEKTGALIGIALLALALVLALLLFLFPHRFPDPDDMMRRTHPSLMRELDVDPKIVADQQGHTLDVNLNVYTQTSMESRINAVTQLESALVH
jgi:hypothetical protein